MSDATAVYSILMELAGMGAVGLRKFDDGCWHANVKFPAPQGVTAEASSDFKHKTPLDALTCLSARLGGLRAMIAGPGQ